MTPNALSLCSNSFSFDCPSYAERNISYLIQTEIWTTAATALLLPAELSSAWGVVFAPERVRQRPRPSSLPAVHLVGPGKCITKWFELIYLVKGGFSFEQHLMHVIL